MTVATWSDWRAAVGAVVPAGPHGTWTVRSCSDRRTSAGWATWDVTFLAPAGTGQETVVLDLPGAGPQTLLAVPSAAHPDGALLVATFVVPDDAPAGADPTGHDPGAADPTDLTHPTTDGTRGPAADAGTEA
ncbi:hypothetical protein ACFO3K_14045 [Cellulomonas algicola]|uniref:Uncharacterized protein n=1 Tax=Cellulomonas algicola TaxID=2071633 RepID=A0A401V2V7_9CELL|nr:hypothetical protein [Cellulomonas algicola]GCD21249.1 hypothetical protein CTKZ_28110 [Cellulomonas algicola]